MRGSLGTANSRFERHFAQVNVLETNLQLPNCGCSPSSSVTLSLGGETHGRCDVAEDAISIGGVDLADPDTYVSGMPFEAFRKLRRRAPVAWHPYKEGPGFLALTG